MSDIDKKILLATCLEIKARENKLDGQLGICGALYKLSEGVSPECISKLVQSIMRANYFSGYVVVPAFIDEPGRWTRRRSELLGLVIEELQNEFQAR